MNGWLAALLIALCGGLAVGFQGVLNSLAGRALGAPLTGLLVNVAGGTLSLLLLALFSRSLPFGAVDAKAAFTVALAGGIGVFVVFSIAFCAAARRGRCGHRGSYLRSVGAVSSCGRARLVGRGDSR